MALFLKILTGIATLIITIGIILSVGKQPQPFAENSQSAIRLQSGPLKVASYNEVFIDKSRPTNANGSYPGSNQRELEGTVWHPENNNTAPYPLVIYSHGYTSDRNGGAYLAEQLASMGYVVAAVNYPLTNRKALGGPNVKDVINQPADISFLIDTLLTQSDESNHPLTDKVDPKRIGVAGISLGGMTSTLAAFHPTKSDPRISAVVSIAGPTRQFTKTFFEHNSVPFLMLATDTDAIVTYEDNAQVVTDHVPGSQLITIRQASHVGFAGTAGILRWINNPDSVGCFMVLRNIEDDITENDPWLELLGTEQQGINYNATNELCEMDPLPAVMNPLRQQMITSVVVSSFFDSQFSHQANEREAASVFLSKTLATELEEVDYRQATL